jgi:L-threonylcarbamoyladenylate synthase
MLSELVDRAVYVLKTGGLVAVPTETVYGLGADAKNPDALKKIFLAKQRPIDHPLIVHIGDIPQLSFWARDIPPEAFKLAEAFWPGPLTLILKKSADVLDLVTGGQDTIALRVPGHPVALALLKKFGGGIAAPSANRFGRISPTTTHAVYEELGNSVDLILEGGNCEVGLESTILDLSRNLPVILRPGMITKKEIENVLQVKIAEISSSEKDVPRVSGSLESHYAPQTKLQVLERCELMSYIKKINFPVVVLVREALPFSFDHVVLMPKDAKSYAHDLYQTLRELDKKNFQQLIVESVPDEEEWSAVRDRLGRAAGGLGA